MLQLKDRDPDTRGWTEGEVDDAIKNTDIVAMSAPLFVAYLYQAAGIFAIVPVDDAWNFVETWVVRGNRHIVIDIHNVIHILGCKLWLLVLRVALGKLALTQLLAAFFEDSEVKYILDEKNKPPLAELACLRKLFFY
jgi:hypothetical protein